jgi:nitrite reductase/ring-hydroxylating ferredoxin subunit
VKEAYFKPEYVALEKERLWSRVWQMACRVEELPKPGDYVSYDIADESIIVVRSQDGALRAFHNACQHRGRRLVEGCGHMERIRCKFHGWMWRLDGTNIEVTQRGDWGGSLDDQDIGLRKVELDTWAGFVFINLNPQCEPLAEYLEEVPSTLDVFQLERMRYRWRKWLVMPCNWKIALEAFNEGYHVGITHHQLRRFGLDHFLSRTHGKHSMFGAESNAGTLGVNSSKDEVADIRGSLGDFYAYMKGALDSNMTDTLMHVSAGLTEALPKGTPPKAVVESFTRMAIAADAARGVNWPPITREQYGKAGIDWHVFPNMVFLPMATNFLGYRARPNGDDPNSCIFEVYHLERFPEGEEPKVVNVRNDDIYDGGFWGEILLQDFQQMEGTHRGVKSSGFRAPRYNPLQETPLINFHRVYHEYLSKF